MSIEAEGYKPTPGEHLTDEAKREIGERVRFWNEFWKKHEFYGIKMDETEQKHIEESINELWPKAKEVFGDKTEIGYVPKGLISENLYKILILENSMPEKPFRGLSAKDFSGYMDPESVDMPRNSLNEGYAFAFASQEIPDADSLGYDAKSSEEWLQSKENLMTLHERLLAGIQFKKKTGQDLDTKGNILYGTLCPSSKFEQYGKGERLVVTSREIATVQPNFKKSDFGVRRVITKK